MKATPSSVKWNFTMPGSPTASRTGSRFKMADLFARPVRYAVCAVLVAAAPCAIAENDLGGWTGFKEELPDPDGGEGSCFVLKPGGIAVSSTLIPVDPAKSYKLSGKFRAQDDGEVRLYFGVDCYDADQVQIQSGEIDVIKNSETTLAAGAAVGDTVLKVTDASKWKPDTEGRPYARVAFNVDPSGTLHDLPNRDLSGAGIPSIRQVGESWEVELAEPLEKAYPKGTNIRRHRNSGRFCYIEAARNEFVPQEWLEKSGELSGTSESGSTFHQFWPGTRFVRLAVVSDFPRKVQEEGEVRSPMLARDLKFSEDR
jgi:hypothetical protein